jgi:hypothetical protein
MGKLSVLKEMGELIKVRKKYWLVPIIFVLLALGGLMILVESSPISPFIYAIF